MKRIISILLAFAMFFSLSACGWGRPKDKNNGSVDIFKLSMPVPPMEVEDEDDGGIANVGDEVEIGEVPVGVNTSWIAPYWYGWWTILDASGNFLNHYGNVMDAFASVTTEGDIARITVWDVGTTADDPLATCTAKISHGNSVKGRLISTHVSFFPLAEWNGGEAVTELEAEPGDWIIDPADSTVTQFSNMIEIKGHYSDYEDENNSFDYYIYLRPWGTLWDDVRNGDTTGCIYSDMMPFYYDEWYLPVFDLDVTKPYSDWFDGFDAIEKAKAEALDPSEKEFASGDVSMNTLKRCLPWCQSELNETTSYNDVAEKFNAHGEKRYSKYEFVRVYRWSATDDDYIQISFDLHEDGTETFKSFVWNGID